MAKPVKQRNWNDCAVACLASVLERPYAEVMEKVCSLGLVESTPNAQLGFDDMKKVLRNYRVVSKFSTRGFDPDHPAILMFSWTGDPQDRFCLHCNVYDPRRKRLLDPGEPHLKKADIVERMALWKKSGQEALVVYEV